MPIFEYRCSSCNEVFEYLRLSRSDNHVECPRCGGEKAEQMLSVFSAQTGGKGASADCFSRAAGICEAGGGAMT